MTSDTTVRAAKGAVGTEQRRLEGRDKATGAARYAGEVPFAGLAHGWLAVSTVTRGRIRSVDTAAVLGMPGVLTVLHHGNAPRINVDHLNPKGMTLDPIALVFQNDRVPHMGWPVALVVAETSEQAREAAEALAVTYEKEPFDVAFSSDHPDAYVAPGPAGPAVVEKGDLQAELAASAVIVDAEYTTPEEHHSAMEPHAVTAFWDGDRLQVADSNQGAFRVATDLAGLFSLDPTSVRVRSDHVGGGFGGKVDMRPHQVAAVMAASVLQRPVRVVMTRRQVFSLTGYRSPTRQHIRLGADAVGRLRALEHRSLSQTSSVYQFVEAAAGVGRVMYDAEAHHTTNRVVRLDVPTPTYTRAPSEAPGSFALESAIDELAEKCGLDPIELRARNEPDTGPISGLPFSSNHMVACLREGARRFGWADRDPRPGLRREGRWLIGTGTAAAAFYTLAAPSTASATAEADGTFTVRIAAADIGTGARTALRLVAADALGVPAERVRVHVGDSDFGPAIIAGGSMGTRSWGWAVAEAAEELRKRIADGPVIPAEGITARSNTAAALAALAKKERHAYGAQFAEVAVDTTTGEVRVRRLLGMFAAGVIVNPLTARNQLIGGMTWGLSMALHEEAIRDRHSGGLVGADLAGYHFAANADVPHIEVDWLNEGPDPDDPIGVKGIGEIGIVGTAAAIANAVWHATGVRHRHLPIRPDRVLLASTETPDA